jgi:hypothetical protein
MSVDRPLPYQVYHIPGRRSVLVTLSYAAWGEKRAEAIEKWLDDYPGGRASPGAQADYFINRKGIRGVRLVEAWDPAYNVRDFTIPETAGKHILSLDFGGSDVSQTACIGGCVTPRYVLIYMEHVSGSLSTRAHKERIRARLRNVMPWLAENFSFATHFDTVGDCTGVGYKLDYKDDPFPLVIMNSSDEEGWRSVDSNASLLNSLCVKAKRCCYREWPDSQANCGACNKELQVDVGILVHPRCLILREQVPARVRDEDTGKRDDDVPHDVFDALLYFVRRVQRTKNRAVRTEDAKRPWWSPEPKKADFARPLRDDADANSYYGPTKAVDISKWL